MSYQWLKDGARLVDAVRISGANASVLRIELTNPDDSGVYACEIRAEGGAERVLPRERLASGEIGDLYTL